MEINQAWIDEQRQISEIVDMVCEDAPGSEVPLLKQIEKSQTAADVAPVVHGVWSSPDWYETCSNCGASFDDASKYCPSCGARMDGGEPK